MSDDFQKFTTPRADEELHQGAPTQVVMGVNPEDGLPMQVAPRNFDQSPVLSEETLICMADKRSFVLRRSDGSVWLTFQPSEVERLPNGQYVARAGLTRQRITQNNPSQATMSWGELEIQTTKQYGSHIVILVEPIRPQCAHYLRQQTDLSADRDGRYYARACMAQKTEEGEFYSLRDTLIAACGIRNPRHLESEIAILDKFDEELMTEAKSKQSMEEFDVDQALAAEAKHGGLGVLGG